MGSCPPRMETIRNLLKFCREIYCRDEANQSKAINCPKLPEKFNLAHFGSTPYKDPFTTDHQSITKLGKLYFCF